MTTAVRPHGMDLTQRSAKLPYQIKSHLGQVRRVIQCDETDRVTGTQHWICAPLVNWAPLEPG